jgi:hypothetical protein
MFNHTNSLILETSCSKSLRLILEQTRERNLFAARKSVMVAARHFWFAGIRILGANCCQVQVTCKNGQGKVLVYLSDLFWTPLGPLDLNLLLDA